MVSPLVVKKKLLTNLFIAFIYIFFSLSSWRVLELGVDSILTFFKRNTEINQIIIYSVIMTISLLVLIITNRLDLLADERDFGNTILTKGFQIFIGMIVIIFWIAAWDGFDLIIEMFIINDVAKLIIYLLLTILTTIILIKEDEMDMLIW